MSESPNFPHFSHPNAASVRLVLVRHGQTEGNAQGLLHGRTDLPLNDVGVLQAERAAARIQQGFRVDAVVSSPLLRARVTASIIGNRLGIEPSQEPDLQEMDFGDFEGISVDQLFADHPELAARAFDPSDRNLRWPNGESRSGFHQRVARVFTSISHRFEGKTAVVVSHNGVLGSFLARVRGHPPDDWQAYRLANCAVSSVEIISDGTIVHAVNDCDHLDGLISTIVAAPGVAR